MEKLTCEQIEEFRTAFELFDKDHSGAISADELGTVMRNLGLDPSQDELRSMVELHDFDSSGQIEFNEFCQMMCHHMPEDDREEQLKTAFRTFDSDNSGKISAQELKQVMTNLGENLTEDEINEMIQEADRDGDGQINYEEFVLMMVSKT